MPDGWCRAEGEDTRKKTQIPFYRTGAPVTLQLFGTVGAIHLLLVENKALVGQIHGAFFAVEAVVVPGLSFIGHHTGAFTKPCGGNKSEQERQLSGHRWQPGRRLCPFMELTSTQAASAWCPAPCSTAHCPPRCRDLRRCQSSSEAPLLSRTHIPSHRQRPVTDAHRPPSTTSFFDLGQGHGIKVATRRQTWAVCGVCTYRASRSC